MKALRKLNDKQFTLVTQPLRDVAANEVLIKVHYAGICGTDLHIIDNEYRHRTPVTLGHEYAGTIEQIGASVQGMEIGERVVSLTAVHTCGVCTYCQQEIPMLCEERQSIGSFVDGAFAEYIIVPEHAVYKIPDHLSMQEAALTEPLACAVRCLVERGAVSVGDDVLISGPGTLGMLAALVARSQGANVTIVGTKMDEQRLAEASRFGAHHTFYTDDKEQYIEQFDVVVECAGNEYSANDCIAYCKKSGLYIQLGLFGKKIPFDADLLLTKEISYTNGFATTPRSWEIALQLLETKKVQVAPLITNIFSLDDWEEAFQTMRRREGYKTLFQLVP